MPPTLRLMSILGPVLFCLSPAAGAAEDDERNDFVISPYVGVVIDSFAAGSVNDYLNEEASGQVEERATAGFEFAYRLVAPPDSGRQFWVYGRTTHGVRSADVDCRATPDIPICEPFALTLQNPTERGLYLLRNASSLEGHVGLRWEFRQIREGSAFSARPYISAELGFVTVSDGPDDVADVHQLAIGAQITTGDFKHSYFEVGYGRNDLILENRSERLKLNARVVRRLGNTVGSAFAHIAVDVDGGNGSDSIQTYLGLAFPIGERGN